MCAKAAIGMLPVFLLATGIAVAQSNKPLFLDNRRGEDLSLIDVTEFTEQYPKAAVKEYRKGVQEARKGHHEAAVGHLEAAIKIEPNFFNAHNSLAILFQDMLRYKEAEQQYREAGRLNPRSIAPMVNLASLHIEEAVAISRDDSRAARGILNDALANLNDAFEMQPDSTLAHYLTGVVYELTAFYEESEAHFKRALDSGDKRMIAARLRLAEIYVRIQEWDNVVAQLDAYLEERPSAPNRQSILALRDAAAEKITVTGK